MSPPKSLDLRVVKAYGSKGYNVLRISVVTHAAANDTSDGLFTYANPFRYRWKQLFLRSGLLTLPPGQQETTLCIDGATVHVRLPEEDAGVRGIVFADPCVGSPWLNCSLGVDTFLTTSRLPALLNAAAPQVHLHQISLGRSLSFCLGALPNRSSSPGGRAAICHRPLGVWHPQKRSEN
jgi:hypothetical protein